MNTKFLQLAFLIIALVVSAHAQAPQLDLNKPIPVDPKVKIGKLENGLTYYILKNEKPEKKVELRLAINAGSILERDDQQGLAHFLEHMAFNGSTNFEKNELVSYLQSIGVQFGSHLNAFTSFDETVYMLSIPTEKPELLDKGLQVLSDWAGGLTLDPAEIDKERGVVLEEHRLGTGADQRMRDRYFPKLFQGSRYADRLPIGTEENLKTFKHQSLKDFYEDWYRPDLMAVVAVGDFDPVEMEAKIKAQFSGLKAKREKKERPVYGVPDHPETLIAIEKDKEAPFTSAQIIFKRDKTDPKTLADMRAGFVRYFFGAMLNARIDEIRQTADSPFLFAGSSFGDLVREKGSYSVFTSAKQNKVIEALGVVLRENRRAEEFGFHKTELERQKIDYQVSLENRFKERDKTESNRMVMDYVWNFLSGSSIEGTEFEYMFAKMILPTITVEEINTVAKDAIKKENRVVIITGPDKPDAKYPSESEVAKLLKDSESVAVTPYVDNVSSEPLVAEMPTKISVAKESFDKLHGITHWTLSNGINVWFKKTDFKEDQILMEGFSPGGSSVLPDSTVLQFTHADRVASESGLGKFSKIELDKKLAGINARAWAGYSGLYESVSGSSTPKDFETMLQLLYLRFTDVNFDEKTLGAYKSRNKALYGNLASDPQYYFYSEVAKIQGQNHPRFIPPYDAAQFDKLDLAEMKAVYNERFSDASDYNFIFVGNIDPVESKPLILKYLGNLPITKKTENWKDVGPDDLKGPLKKVVYKGQAAKSQVDISISRPVKFNVKDQFLLSSMGKILTNKLIEILREEKGGVYGAGARAWMSRIPRARASLSISFPCGPDNVEDLTNAALNELRKIQNGEIDQKDVDKIIESELVDLRERSKQNGTWVNRIAYTLKNNKPILTYEQFEERAKSLTVKEIQRVAKEYFDIEKRVEFVLMPEASEKK